MLSTVEDWAGLRWTRATGWAFFGPAHAFWIAARPGMLLCDYCYQAAQVLAGDIRCARRAGG